MASALVVVSTENSPTEMARRKRVAGDLVEKKAIVLNLCQMLAMMAVLVRLLDCISILFTHLQKSY